MHLAARRHLCKGPPRAAGSSSTTSGRQELLLERARQLYEVAWSQPRGVLALDAIMAPDHVQLDAVWQPQRGSSSSMSPSTAAGGAAQLQDDGRRRMKRGILAYRGAYPDIQFVVQRAAAVPGADEVFVLWTAAGTNTGPIREQPPSGRRVQFAGITLLCFNTEGQIQQSMVFRQAPDDEARFFIESLLQRLEQRDEEDSGPP